MNITQKQKNIIASVVLGVGVVTVAPAVAFAAPSLNSQLTQEISAGTLSTDIVDASGVSVANPSFAMSSVNVSNDVQQATGVFGSSSQRIMVDNPGGAADGWTLAWNATNPGTAEWVSGANSYKYNDTAATGQLTVDPSTGTLTSNTGTNTGITLGAPAAFSGTTPVTLMSASSSADDIWNGYATGISLEQSVPASTPAGSYSIDMTQTVTGV